MPRELNLPPASSRPPGSITIGLNPDERSSIRDGVLLIALGTLAVGATVGVLWGARRGARESNPRPAILLKLPRWI